MLVEVFANVSHLTVLASGSFETHECADRGTSRLLVLKKFDLFGHFF